MYIYMTKEQAQRLGKFLKRMKALRELEVEGPYYWTHMAKEIGISVENLRKLKNGKGGMHLDTANALIRAFGDEMLDILGIKFGLEPTFKVKPKDQEGQGDEQDLGDSS